MLAINDAETTASAYDGSSTDTRNGRSVNKARFSVFLVFYLSLCFAQNLTQLVLSIRGKFEFEVRPNG